MNCKLCQDRKAFAPHHFNGKEIHLENLSKEKRKRYEELESQGDESVEVCTICHSEIHGNIAKWSPIKLLYKLRKDLIEERKATNNRIRALKEYELDVSDLEGVTQTLKDKEKELSKRLKKVVREKAEIWQWLKKVKGIGKINTAGLIANLNPIDHFDTVSAVWSYCGLMPKNGFDEDGNYENYEHYRQATKERRTLTAYDIGESFVRSPDSFYREIYDKRREETEADERFGDPEEEKGHYHSDARRVAVKKFLSHLWTVWRKMKGLEVTEPYILKQDGHNRRLEIPHTEHLDIEVN